MNDIGGEYYSSGQSATTPVIAPALPKDSFPRPHGETLKTMNPTPNGYNNVANHTEGSDVVKNHQSDSPKKSSDLKHNSDHVKKKEDHHKEGEKHKSKDKSDKDHHKEKRHKEGGSSSESSKHKKDEANNVGDKPKSDNFKENEKVKDKHKESKDKHKDKHKDKESKHKDKESKHKDKEHKDKEKHKDKDSKHKDKEHKDKSKSDGEKHKEKHKDKHKDKEHKDKHKDKHREHKDKSEKDRSEKDKSEKNKAEKEKKVETPKPPPPKVKVEVKDERLSDEDEPLARFSVEKVMKVKREPDEDYSDEAPKKKKVKSEKLKKRKATSDDESDYDMKPTKKVKKEKGKPKKEPVPAASPTKRKGAKKEEEEPVWKWWEEEKLEGGIKWKTLSHSGPVFAPPYERVPKSVKFYYDGKHMVLSEVAEEVAGFYGRMLDHDYTSKEVFNTNFFKDWRKVMTKEEREIIKDLSKCNFKDFDLYYKQKSEERKAMTKEEKLAIKKENEGLTEKYGFCMLDGHKQKIGNFKIEPPGLFRGRGEHPKMGMLKRRVEAEDILINIGKEAKVPDPPPGHKWKEVRHDNTVSWLSSWSENILGSTKYIMLNPSSRLKGEKDLNKYETARKLKAHADRIRADYTRDFKSKEMRVRQRAVALYFIDKLALRAGNEKDEDTADTVGCCSLRVEHITLDEEKDGKEFVVTFDFLGKDSIRYYNSVPVEKKAYRNLKIFMENKQPGDDLFDRLNTSILNKYLNDLMEGLTAKVFRTYNASKTLQEQLNNLTTEDMSIPEKILAYNRANRAVAILCNHQRAVPKGFDKSMDALNAKITEKRHQIKEQKKEVKDCKKGTIDYDKKKKRLNQLEEQLKKLELQKTDKEENKQIALGTSKLNYLDPRISVGWCKKWDVPIEKVYNKTQRDKFRWAIDMATEDYQF
ncbi:hypothetical protein JTE90_017140 [Oedothorax gibbosus]|uniref:DNA topoisomerase I n=1 Tax=Oedothorax gibbosus TaxID=931172 RepID=A0AAV6UDZ0_9ARAC|nr:hypothetical protein JTE90_017140 [Oedothorax gibbosus]